MGENMIGVHNPTGAVISPTLISPERDEWFHAAHSRPAYLKEFLRDLLKLMYRYHMQSKSLNPT
jgi:hypothetical protein